MSSVDTGDKTKADYRRVIACQHFCLAVDPLLSDALNVGVSGCLSFVLVEEDGKIKLVCWKCLPQCSVVPI